jgi:hypothetical protein
LQCLVAITVSKSVIQKIAMAAIAIVLGFITVFAVVPPKNSVLTENIAHF